jgi:phenylalanyl-tRNA synthetase beta chain
MPVRAIAAASSAASNASSANAGLDEAPPRAQRHRSISAVVDVTNYVMLELGQPLHAFDNARLRARCMCAIRPRAKTATAQRTDRDPRSADTALIADDPCAGPGRHHGRRGERHCTAMTTELFSWRAPSFRPMRLPARRVRWAFPPMPPTASSAASISQCNARCAGTATQLIIDICGGQAGPVVEAVDHSLPMRAPVRLRVPSGKDPRHPLGIDRGAASRLFKGLGFPFHTGPSDVLHRDAAFAPFRHRDRGGPDRGTRQAAWLRQHPRPAPKGSLAMMPQTELLARSGACVECVAARDYQEVVNYSFVDAGWEQDFCANPAGVLGQSDCQPDGRDAQQPDRWPGGESRHQSQAAQDRVRVFETGRCFLRNDSRAQVPGFDAAEAPCCPGGARRPGTVGRAGADVDFL